VKRTALLLAGRRPGVDPLAAAEGQALKALIPIAGRPMVAHVAETLLACPSIGAVRVLTQDVEAIGAVLPTHERLTVHRSGAGIARSVAEIAGGIEAPWPVLVTTADHPLLSARTIESFIARSEGADVAVAVVERQEVLDRFPGNRRTWLKFRGGWWTGANLFALNGPAARNALEVWSGVERDRKKGWKLVLRFGPLLLLRALTRTISLADALDGAGRRLGLRVRPVALADALAAVDVDKPEDLAIARAILEGGA
jgi:CTP:molybdopterin cytidylyltransferase MocA